MTKDAHKLQFSDCILSMDASHCFSPSYRGMSSRTELGVMTLLFVVLRIYPGVWVEHHAPLLYALLGVAVALLIFFPLWIRRGRQTGCIAWGLMPMAPMCLVWLFMLYLGFNEGWETTLELLSELLGGLPTIFSFIASLPLYLYGGFYAGRKNELHRAAIAGDRARAERMLAYFPTAPLKRSEKGYLASQYAEYGGHRELAAWLREQEQRLQQQP